MKSLFLAILFTIILSATGYSQEPFSKYIPITSTNALPIITFENVDDLLSIAAKEKITTAFILANSNDKKSSWLLILDKSVYYQVQLNGYKDITTYRTGTKQGFLTSPDYEEGLSLKIQDGKIYYYYKRNTFETLDDCFLAYKNGFIFDKYPLKSIGLPNEISPEQMNYLNKIFPVFSSQQDRFYESNKVIDARNQRTQGLSDLSSRQPEAYKITKYVLKSETQFFMPAELSRNMNYNNSSNQELPQVKEFQIYYLAKFSGIDTFEEYQNAHTAKQTGYNNLSDLADGKAKGFYEGRHYYKAKVIGIPLYKDYTIATQMGITNSTEFEPYKAIITQIEKNLVLFPAENISALIYYLISTVPSKKSYSYANLLKYLETEYAKWPKLEKVYSRLNDRSDWLINILKNPLISKLGKYDQEGGVFTRN